jgi:hypothetical protein
LKTGNGEQCLDPRDLALAAELQRHAGRHVVCEREGERDDNVLEHDPLVSPSIA